MTCVGFHHNYRDAQGIHTYIAQLKHVHKIRVLLLLLLLLHCLFVFFQSHLMMMIINDDRILLYFFTYFILINIPLPTTHRLQQNLYTSRNCWIFLPPTKKKKKIKSIFFSKLIQSIKVIKIRLMMGSGIMLIDKFERLR